MQLRQLIDGQRIEISGKRQEQEQEEDEGGALAMKKKKGKKRRKRAHQGTRIRAKRPGDKATKGTQPQKRKVNELAV